MNVAACRNGLGAAVCVAMACFASAAEDAAALRLVPFPKEVRLEKGVFPLAGPLTLEAPADRAAVLAGIVAEELKRAGGPALDIRKSDSAKNVLRLSGQQAAAVEPFALREKPGEEDYSIRIAADGIVVQGGGPAGLLHGTQTLVQLIRANRRDGGLPCLTIRDWPSLRWRCFQNDLTRGPSAKLETLKRQIGLGSLLKMNLFTYYMEYQYAFAKHPEIGPADGSLTPSELRRLVEFGRSLGVEILGNQQSFGHMGRILKHDRYAGLRENAEVLSPVNEGTYQLLDDLYSEVCPVVPFPFFNVCCDETWGLGSGPSKALAQQIGEGGVYVKHLLRVHDLLAENYKKRMMMWGDIILKHPDKLDQIPKDTIMLTWGYDARPTFEAQIVPFAKSGFEFFVCPGTSDWSRILPDFATAEVNIRNFVRDGVKHGALGMINTEWKDDGESLNAPNWHGYAWGAECAWNGSATEPADFNRRVGAVLFGEPGERFGRGVGSLAEICRLPCLKSLPNRQFWEPDFPLTSKAKIQRDDAAEIQKRAASAVEQLELCRREATVNADWLEALVFGAERILWLAERKRDAAEMVGRYESAQKGSAKEADAFFAWHERLLLDRQRQTEDFCKRFSNLWLAENKPYALDWTTNRYKAMGSRFEKLAKQLAEARRDVAAGRPLPTAKALGLVD